MQGRVWGRFGGGSGAVWMGWDGEARVGLVWGAGVGTMLLAVVGGRPAVGLSWPGDRHGGYQTNGHGPTEATLCGVEGM